MSIGDVNRPTHRSFGILRGKYQENEVEESHSTSTQEGGKQPGSQAYGPGKSTPYGSEGSIYDGAVFELQDQTLESSGPGGTVAYRGETRALGARARLVTALDLELFDDGKMELRAEGQAQASLIRSSHGVEYRSPAAQYAGQEVLWAEVRGNGEAFVGVQLDAKAKANLSFSNDLGIGLGASAFAGAKASAEVEARVYVLGGSAGVRAYGEAWAGAQAWVGANLGAEGFKASVGAFAGAKAGGTVGADVLGIGIEATGEVWAGAGAEAGVSASWEDGKIVISADLGGAVGTGAGGGVALTIDTNRLVGEGMKLVEEIGEVADDLADDAGEWVEEAGEWVEDTTEDVVEATEDAVAAVVDFFNW